MTGSGLRRPRKKPSHSSPSLGCERVGQLYREAARRRRVHPPVGTRAAEGPRGGAAFPSRSPSPRFARRPLVVSSWCDTRETQEGEMRSGALGFLLREPTAVLFTRKHCTIVGSRSKQLLMIGLRS
jgi:hypothetical protein